MFTLVSVSAGSFRRIFMFYKVCSPTPWIFYFSQFSDVSDLDTLRVSALLCNRCLVGHRSTLEGYHSIVLCFQRFQRGSKVVWVTWRYCFHTTWFWVSIPILSAARLLSQGWLVHWYTIGWRSSCVIILIPHFPSDKRGSEILGGTDSWLW